MAKNKEQAWAGNQSADDGRGDKRSAAFDSGYLEDNGSTKKSLLISAVAVVVIAAVLAAVPKQEKAEPHTHIWADATCMAPKTCETCEETEGLPLEHRMQEADCTNPRICQVCGTTEGLPLEHRMQEADCTNPRICQVCGTTEGAPLGHNWQAATNRAPAYCAECGIEEGRSLGYPLVRCKVLEDTNHPGGQGDILLGNWQDTSGGWHWDTLRFWVADFGGYSEDEYIRYDLGGTFTQLDLTIAPESNSVKDTRSKIYIYSGTELLYESDWITTDMAPVSDTVTFPPCDELTILCVTDSPAYHYCIVNAMLYN